jgi:hypothetical protein
MWFMHDGAPTHFLRIVRHHLNQTIGEQWIGRGGQAKWPAQLPDLNILDFWLWEHLKTLVYSAPISDLEVLQQRVKNACLDIRLKPGIFDRMLISVRQRAESRVEMRWNRTEHLL